MFAFDIVLKKPKRILVLFAAVGIILATVCAAATIRMLSRPQAAVADISLDVEDGDYAGFFRQLGITADGRPVSQKTVTIPAVFNQTYTDYNALQQRAGLDLTRYSGKQARLLTFTVQSEQSDCAALLVYRGRVIGGHLTHTEYGSEMLPLFTLSEEKHGTTG